MSKYDQFGVDTNPFERTIADEETATTYDIVGREDQEARLDDFVQDALQHPENMSRALVFGDYGTGKSHHLIQLRERLKNGVNVNGTTHHAIGAYVGNLGLSIRALYNEIIEETLDFAPELEDLVEDLDPVEPESSVEETFEMEQLMKNVATNLRKLSQEATSGHDYNSIFIFIDEAEDIVNADESKVKDFVRSFLHVVNELSAARIHILLGFSQKAKTRITGYEEEDGQPLGNALFQRFAQRRPIRLGNLLEDDVKELLVDRLDHHRTTNQGELYPIVEDTVQVVQSLTNGHPREILSIYASALQYAAEADLEAVNGDAIFYAIRGFDSLVRDEQILSTTALSDLEQALREFDSDAANDFENLRGRLIGEDDQITQEGFTCDPEALLQPISVTSDTDLRVLERIDEHGRYCYKLHDEVKDFLFGTSGGEGTLIADLDIRATSAENKYQAPMTRGFAIALREADYATIFPDPVQVEYEDYQLEAWLVEYQVGEGYRKPTVAVAVYNGPELPKQLAELFINAIEEKGASFGILLKQGQSESAELNKYVKNLEGLREDYYRNRVLTIDLTEKQREEYAYGKLLGLGDSDVELEDDAFDVPDFVDSLSVNERLTDAIQETVLPYPDSIGRRVVEKMEQNPQKDFTITGLRDELDLQQFELRSETMNGYREQSLVAKNGQHWMYPDVEDDRPPWYQVYAILQDKGPLTRDELKDEIKARFVLGCNDGEEGEMLQWYLDRLRIAGYVEREQGRAGEGVTYDVVSVADQVDETATKGRGRLEEAREKYERALELNIPELNDYDNQLDDIETTINDVDSALNPDSGDLKRVKDARGNAESVRDELQSQIESQQEQLEGEVENLAIRAEELEERVEDIEQEDVHVDDFGVWREELSSLIGELRELVSDEAYSDLADRVSEVESELDDIEQDLDDIAGAKQRCVKKYQEAQQLKQDVESDIASISEENPQHNELNRKLNEFEEIFDEYDELYSATRYDDALTYLQEQFSPLEDVADQTERIATRQEQLQTNLDSIQSDIKQKDDPEALELFQNTRENVKQGHFAEAEQQLQVLRDLLEGPTPEERFKQAVEETNGSLSEIVEMTDFDWDDALSWARQLYNEGDVSDIRLVKSE
ncbi:hypothetical protein NDI56_11230 [Haloarcula sp. S1CR25-12]|uniref:AAA family ATPase n=1 Tax=Haloarcula saliterrae TaxID=2950534 RepID=A0ABU2FCI2_9EURY|nr:hypothetical protein [Haloarcula sp. S1CR25-12]MDS0259967.1 hypothetical protein [Haloarcula sp. S1CR25-12]